MDSFFDNITRSLREANERKRAQNERDRTARTARLASGAVEKWTKVIKHAASIVKVGKRPCDYEPWSRVLEELGRSYRFVESKQPHQILPYETLMEVTRDVAQPKWEEPRRDLIEFAFAFLEADVMLFRSGYAKRHLIKRLQQSDLNDLDVMRVNTLLRRAVLEGTGLEEARAYRKIAAHLVAKGRLPLLKPWLEEAARGAILTLDRASGGVWVELMITADISAADKDRLSRVNWLGPSKWGLVYPEMTHVVRAGKLLNDPEQRTKRTAFLMFEAIRVRQVSEPR